MNNPVEELIEAIKKTKWPTELKQQLIALVPAFGAHALAFYQKEVSIFDSFLASKYLVNVAQEFTQALRDLSAGRSTKFATLLANAQDDWKMDFGRYALPFVLDAKKVIAQKRVKLGSETLELVEELESAFFIELPFEEFVAICDKSLMYYVSKLPLVMEFKRLLYRKASVLPKDWNSVIVSELNDNEELIADQMVIDKKSCPGSVRNYLVDFIASTSKPVSQRTSLEIVQYLKTSPNVQRLSKNKQDTLFEILKLYLWLVKPQTSAEEVEEYEALLERQWQENANVLDDKIVPAPLKTSPVQSRPANTMPSPLKPVLPPPGPLAANRIKNMDFTLKTKHEEIDKKIEDLRNRVKR